MTPLEFARLPASKWECCGGFVARWLAAAGVKRTPPTAEILRLWRSNGAIQGAEIAFKLMGFERCEPAPNCVAVAEQSADGGPLIGVIDAEGNFVTRSFGAVAVRVKPRIIAAWRIPGSPHV